MVITSHLISEPYVSQCFVDFFFQVEDLQGWNFNLSAFMRSVQQTSWLGLILLITEVLQQGKCCV